MGYNSRIKIIAENSRMKNIPFFGDTGDPDVL